MTAVIDHTSLRFNQSMIIGLLMIGFLTDQLAVVLLVTAVMVVGTIWPQAGLFKLIYGRLLKPRGWLKPDPVADDPQPHLFAQGLGGIFLVVALILGVTGLAWASWALVWVVAILAAVNLFFGFCLGCFIFFQLARRGLHLSLPWWQPIG